MIGLSPQQIQEALYVFVETAAGAGVTKDPAVLPGMQALGSSFVGLGAGTETYADIEAAFQLLLTELGFVNDPNAALFTFLLDGVNKQLADTMSKSAPPITDGIVKDVLTTAGNAINAACTLYVKDNPPAATASAK